MRIKRVTGAEPRREGEYPTTFWVGYPKTGDTVHHIFEETENLGQYGITWFVAKRKDGSPIAKMNALHVAEVEYYKNEPHKFTGNGPGVVGADNCQICGRFYDEPETEECRN